MSCVFSAPAVNFEMDRFEILQKFHRDVKTLKGLTN
jgi:hypothetical protein